MRIMFSALALSSASASATHEKDKLEQEKIILKEVTAVKSRSSTESFLQS